MLSRACDWIEVDKAELVDLPDIRSWLPNVLKGSSSSAMT